MKVGGKRARSSIPRSIGFAEFGRGPVPTDPGRRKTGRAARLLADQRRAHIRSRVADGGRSLSRERPGLL
jgi:hypothetical protein